MNRSFAEAIAPRKIPADELVARAIAGVIVRREFGADPKLRILRGLALESAVAEGVDSMWLHLTEEAEAVIAALKASGLKIEKVQ